MAAKKRDVTEPCPDCAGSGFRQTPAPILCSTCAGQGVVPVGEADQMREPDAETNEQD